MRRLSLVNKKILFGAGPSRSPAPPCTTNDTFPTAEFNRGREAAPIAATAPSRSSVPPHFHSYSRLVWGHPRRGSSWSPSFGRCHLSAGLNRQIAWSYPPIGSKAVRSRPDAAARRESSGSLATRACPHATFVAITLATLALLPPLRCRSVRATGTPAVDPAGRLPPTRSPAPHTGLSQLGRHSILCPPARPISIQQ